MTIGILSHPDHIQAPLQPLLERFGVECIQATQPSVLSRAEGFVFTGSGRVEDIVSAIESTERGHWLKTLEKPFLGIDVGMQLLFEQILPQQTALLGLIPGEVQSLKACSCHSPNMGWHTIKVTTPHPLLKGIGERDLFYFMHREFIGPCAHTIAETTCQNTFSAAVCKGNLMGVQFSPEKSGRSGSMILQNFLEIVRSSSPSHTQAPGVHV